MLQDLTDDNPNKVASHIEDLEDKSDQLPSSFFFFLLSLPEMI